MCASATAWLPGSARSRAVGIQGVRNRRRWAALWIGIPLMIEKVCMVLIFIGVAVGVGIYCRKSTSTVDGFVLGGPKVGPWMRALA